MEIDLYKERKNVELISKNILNKVMPSKEIYKEYLDLNIKQNLNDNSDCRTISTHKNSADSLGSLKSKLEKEIPFSVRSNGFGTKQELNNIFLEETKKRTDNFGREIKKGGKHKIAFADDLDIIKSLLPEKPENNSKHISRKSMRIKNHTPLKNLRISFTSIKKEKRSNSLNNDRSSIKKIIYNISKKKTKSQKKFKNSIVDIINVENLKEETKLNTYSIKNRVANVEEENVCCSCYCSIW